MSFGLHGLDCCSALPGSKKGQMFSTELVIASAIFIAGIVLLVSFWNSLIAVYAEGQADVDMQTAALGISDMFALSAGVPSNWEAAVVDNASAFGLASSPNVISGAKFGALQALNATSYLSLKEKMGAGKFDVYAELNNSTVRVYRFGIPGNLSDGLVKGYNVNRLVLLNDSIYTLRVQVWRNRGNAV